MKMPFRYGCVVDGEYFCPRPELERQLRQYAESGQNLVIQGERRMGKTSLVKKAISGMKGERLLYIDLYGIRTLSDFCRRVMAGVGGVTEKMAFLKKALSLAYRLRPGLTIDSNTGAPTITVDARAAAEPDSPERVLQVEDPVLAPDSVQDAGHNAGPSFAANTFDLSFFIALIAAAALLGVTFSRGKD